MIMLLIVLLSILLTITLISIYIRITFAKCTSNVSMKGKVVIVTGGSRGIGFYTAKNLAARGARVIIGCRDEKRGKTARADIIANTGNEDVIYKNLDLASLESVRQFAADVLTTEPILNVLINNAGVYGYDNYTSDGIVQTVQVNYFGHFLLTLLLLPLLKRSCPGRIVNLSSSAHFYGTFDPCSINDSKMFLGSFRNYVNSKFCMLMFTLELSRRLQGYGVVVNAVHPGVLSTGIATKMGVLSGFLFKCLVWMYNRSVEDGAETVIYAVVSEECADVSGMYFVDCTSRYMSWRVKNLSQAKQLWRYSEKIVRYKE